MVTLRTMSKEDRKILGEVDIPMDDNIISVASNRKKKRKEIIDNFILGVVWIPIGIMFLGLSVYGVHVLYVKGWLFLIFLFIFPMISLIIGIILVGGGVKGFMDKGPDRWTFVLYDDSLWYRSQPNKKDQPSMTKEVSLDAIYNCNILSNRTNVAEVMPSSTASVGRTKQYASFKTSIHITYEENDTLHYFHLIKPDNYETLSTALSYLQNEKGIPIYYTAADNEKFTDIEEEEALEKYESEEIHFSGQLSDFKKERKRLF